MAFSSGSGSRLIFHGPLLTLNKSLDVLKGRNFDLFVYASSPESVIPEITGNVELDLKKNVNPK